MNAYDMTISEDSYDIVLAENVFEHFINPEKVLSETYRVLKKQGTLVVPVFSSIYSKYALHLKIGFKIPWANLFFSQKTIVKALYRLAEDDQTLFDAYPRLKEKPSLVRDVRKYRDLNDITYKKFRKMAMKAGFDIVSFKTIAPSGIRIFAAVIRRIPFLKNSILSDIFSTGASAILIKK